jgi:hypothetical protein
MDAAMVAAAEENQVAELGLAALSPMREVMAVGPVGRPIAARKAAAAVAHDPGAPD